MLTTISNDILYHKVAGVAVLLPVLLLSACEPPVQVSHSGFGAFEADVAVHAEEVAVAWYDDSHGNAEIQLRLFDAALRPLTAEWRLTDEQQPSYEPDVEFLDAGLAVAWYDRFASSTW